MTTTMIINVVVAAVAIAIAFLCIKKGLKPAISWFMISTAALWIFTASSLLSVATPWLIGAGVAWLAVFILVLRTAKGNGKTMIPVIIIVALLIAGVAFLAPRAEAMNGNQQAEQVVKTESGQTTWKMTAGDYTNNRWFADGINEIQTASTKEDAVKAATAWLDRVKTDPNLLAGASKFFLKKDVDKATLVDANGYATDAAVQLTTEMALAIGTAQAITPAEAPTNGVNSGVVDGNAVQASSAGINGDRKAIQITLQNGENVWIMARCGNPVTAGSVGLPTGSTDNPTTPSTPTTPTTPENPLTPKDPSQDVGVNPAVAPWKQDDIASGNEPAHTVSDGNGATVSNGYQADPVQDAANAVSEAAANTASETAAHDAAVSDAVSSGGGVVSDNQSHTVSTPAASDSNW